MSRRYACDRPDCEPCRLATGHDGPQRPGEPPSTLDHLDWPAAGTFERLPRRDIDWDAISAEAERIFHRRRPWLVRKLWWPLADRWEKLSDRHERKRS